MTNQDNTSGTPKKVMVVDDHILFREGLISLFRSTPDFVIVGEAGSVQEGIEGALSLFPDIILMDFTILKIMPDCKIIFLTVHEADDKLFAAIRAGAKGYLPKNVAGSNLISSLRALDRDEIAITRKMTSRIVEEFSRSDLQSVATEEVFTKLSPRELDVLCELQPGVTNHEIAQRLFLSENTVKHHVRNILSKLEVDNRREAGLIAHQAGLTSRYSNTQNKKS